VRITESTEEEKRKIVNEVERKAGNRNGEIKQGVPTPWMSLRSYE
jgi:hypothetical protein